MTRCILHTWAGEVRGLTAHLQTADCIQHSYGVLHDGRLDQKKTNISLIILISINFRIQQLTFHMTQFRVLGFIMDLNIRVQAVCLKQSDKEGGLSFK